MVKAICCCNPPCVPGLFSRSPSCCMLEGQGSTCTSCAIFCAVLLGWESGLHTSFRFVRNTRLSFIILSHQLLYIERNRVLLLSDPDPSLWEHLRSSAIYASSGHSNVTCQVKMQVFTSVSSFHPLTVSITLQIMLLAFMRIQVIFLRTNSLRSQNM